MNIYQADIELSGAKYIRWMLDLIKISADEILIYGWALSVWDSQDQITFRINGQEFEDVVWPVESPDLLQFFGNIPNSAVSRFWCKHQLKDGYDLYPNGFARLSVTGPFGEHRRSYRTSWYLPDPDAEFPMPSPSQIARVIGTSDEQAFRLGGATIVNRFQHLLLDRLGRSLESFESILDWGCGAGRLSRYLTGFSTSVTGIDIDADNIKSCQQTVPMARFITTGTMPPVPLPDGSFDLALGLSVFTHLKQEAQNAWLKELERLVRPQGILLLSVQGLAQMSLYQSPVEVQQSTHRHGIYHVGQNDQLSGMISDEEYYVNTMHSHDYIFSEWGKIFDVLDIIEGIAGNQDVVILRRR